MINHVPSLIGVKKHENGYFLKEMALKSKDL